MDVANLSLALQALLAWRPITARSLAMQAQASSVSYLILSISRHPAITR